MTGNDPFEYDDAAYLAGALSEPDRAAFEAHLKTCPDCAARVEQLRPLVGALGGLDPAAVQAHDPLPDTVLPRLLRAVDAQRRRQRWLVRGLGVVAAACIAALVVAFWPSSSGPAPGPTVRFQAVAAAPVDATATLTSQSWGTRVDLRCTERSRPPTAPPGGYGGAGGGSYRLIVIDRAGSSHDAGSWTEQGDKDVRFVTGTSVPRNDISMLQIVGADGSVLLSVRL